MPIQVTKFNGKVANKSACHLINDKWYEKDLDCFKIHGKWTPVEFNNDIVVEKVKNWSTGEMIALKIAKMKLTYGYVEPNVKGYFNSNIMCPILKSGGVSKIMAINDDIATKMGYVPSYNDEYWYPKGTPGIHILTIKEPYQSLKYNIANLNMGSLKSLFNQHNDSVPTVKAKKIAKLLKNRTFGVEIETSEGFIKSSERAKYGFAALMDGSLRKNGDIYSAEFTSIPLEGEKGVQTLVDFCNLLQQRCYYDHKCSVHVHLGGHKYTKESAVVLVYLLYKLQKEVFELFPFYKYYSKAFNKKDYCSPLPKSLLTHNDWSDNDNYIEEIYKNIFDFNVKGYATYHDFNHHTSMDKFVSSCKKWDISSRYYWVSLVSWMFAPQRTVEFRIHTPTFNAEKILAWILLCNAILKFAEVNKTKIFEFKRITISKVLEDAYNDKVIISNLLNYFKKRKIESSKIDDTNVESLYTSKSLKEDYKTKIGIL